MLVRRSVAPLIIGTFILRVSGGAATVVIGFFLVQLSAHTGSLITSLQVGLLPVAYYATELTLSPFMGALSDRWGRRCFLIMGPLIGLVQVSLFAFTPVNYPLPYLLGLQTLAGVSSSMMTPAVLGYLADYTTLNQARRVRVMSFFELATSGGIGVGVVLGGFAWDRLGRYAFFLLASFYVLVALCMLLAPRVKQLMDFGSVRVVVSRYWRIVRTPRLFIFIPAWISVSALVGVWFSSQITFILTSPTHNAQQLLMGSVSGAGGGPRVSLILGAYVGFFGLCLLSWAFFLRGIPRLWLMLTSVVGIYLACIALEGINHGGLANGVLLPFWILLLMVGIFAESSFAPSALTYLADISEEAAKDRGLLMGLYSIFLAIGQLVGNGLGGVFARNWGFDGLIYLTALLACVALVSLLVLFWVERERVGYRDSSSIVSPAETSSDQS
jgi:MFS family permease